MKIDLSTYSDAGLAKLIAAASKELACRLVEQGPDIIRKPARQKTVVIDEPPEEDKEFALRVKSRAVRGQYVTAEERSRVAEIAEKYEAWVRRQGLPVSAGTGPWRKLSEMSRLPPARER